MEISVEMLQVGLYVVFRDNYYYVLASRAFQEIDPKSGQGLPKPVITVVYDLLPVTGNGDETGEPVRTVRADISEFTL